MLTILIVVTTSQYIQILNENICCPPETNIISQLYLNWKKKEKNLVKPAMEFRPFRKIRMYTAGPAGPNNLKDPPPSQDSHNLAPTCRSHICPRIATTWLLPVGPNKNGSLGKSQI